MAALDAINHHHGRVAAATLCSRQGGRKKNWKMKQDHRSPRFTTRWSELMQADA